MSETRKLAAVLYLKFGKKLKELERTPSKDVTPAQRRRMEELKNLRSGLMKR